MRFQNLKNMIKLYLDEHPIHITKINVVIKSKKRHSIECLFFYYKNCDNYHTNLYKYYIIDFYIK
ncbi:hypothetical protein FHY73_29270 [Bacillus tropicus]|nr:hypothetical protein FHY73_29270 [Bacillus tropicus]